MLISSTKYKSKKILFVFFLSILITSVCYADPKNNRQDSKKIAQEANVAQGVDTVIDYFEKIKSNQNTDVQDAANKQNTNLELDTPLGISEPTTPIKSQDSDTANKKKNAEDLSQLTTVLNVTDADLEALVKTFSKLTGRNYIVDSGVKGKITIHLPTAITVGEALKVFDSVLLLKGFATVPVGENIWKVINAKDAKQTTIPAAYSPQTTNESLVTQILKTTHIGSDEAQKLFSQFISKDGYAQAITGTNLLILVDSVSNIERISDILKEIDIPPLDQDITIIPIQHAEASGVAEKIEKILGQSSGEGGGDGLNTANILRKRVQEVNSLSQQSFNNGLPGSAQLAGQAASGTGKASPLKIIPDDRTNSLIIVADEFNTIKIRALAEQLDSAIDKSSGRFWVYRLEYADAETLSETLSTLLGGGGSSGSSSSKTQGSSISRGRSGNQDQSANALGGAAGNSNTFGGGRSRSSSKSSGSSGRSSGSGSPSLITDSSRVNFDDEISITADPSTNSLIVNANKADFEKLSQVIKMLDMKRKQVLVEATILEVSLNDEVGLGLEVSGALGLGNSGIVSQSNFGGLTNLFTNPAALSDLSIAAASVGTLTLPGGTQIPTQAALITAVSKHSNVNVLSAPTILSTDNEEAEIIVGENVPFVSSTSTNQTNLANTFNQIQRQDVGITLRITPQLGSGDFLSLKIFVEISNVVQGTRNDPNGPTTSIRTTDTMVAVKNGQMIVTGGLIQDSVTNSTRGVPYLEDVPVLGALFKTENELKRRTNLLIFITPQVIQDQFDARENTVQKAGKLTKDLDPNTTNPDILKTLKSDSIDKVFESNNQQNFLENRPIVQDTKVNEETIKDNEIKSESNENKDRNNSKIVTTEKTNNGVVRFNIGNKEESKTENKRLLVFLNPESGKNVLAELSFPLSMISNFKTGDKFKVLNQDMICLGIYNNLSEAEAVHGKLPKSVVFKGTTEDELSTQGIIKSE